MIQPGRNPEIIKSMFSNVALNYDKANSVLSVGIHHLWRKKLVLWSKAKKGSHVLDCATGTGDLAIEFKKIVGEQGRVVGTDFCPEMLAIASQKSMNSSRNIEFSTADVMNLPFKDNQFDIASISFGIRNVSNPVQGLKEMARVTKPGGVIIVLEFGQMNNPVLNILYNFYSEKILPIIGGWVTGQKKAYVYLQKSSANFPCREKFITLMNQTGEFSKVEYKALSFGIAYIYKAQKTLQ
jgi:demethylmenaquinone methyltransferase/2-methoxy-6-polyprenyl-1,4-benzoquinol methylase